MNKQTCMSIMDAVLSVSCLVQIAHEHLILALGKDDGDIGWPSQDPRIHDMAIQ